MKLTAEQAFAARGLDIELADKMGAWFDPERQSYLFEFTQNGELQFLKERTRDKQFRLDRKGVKLQLWNIDALRGLPSPPGAPLVITEGEFDAIAVRQVCGGFVVSVPNGVAGGRSDKAILISEDNRFAYLWHEERLIPEIDQFEKVILATDGDDPGIILRDELALRIGESRCWHVIWPDGCKDANDTLLKYGEDGLRAAIENARPMRPGFLLRPSEIPPRRFEVTYSSGWAGLDQRTAPNGKQLAIPSLMLIRPELMVVTGEPGHGKGQWIRALVCHLAESHGMRCAFLSPEDPAHRIKRDLKRFAMRDKTHPSAEDQRRADVWVDAHFRISVTPDDEPITLDTVESEMTAAALQHGCQVFVLDPWNEVEHAIRSGETETMYIERSLRQLKRVMRKYGLILIIAAHPTKLSPGTKATLYTISGSANWRNKADHGVIVYRPDPDEPYVEVTLEKSKDHETMGIPGTTWMEFKRMKADYEMIGAPQ